MKINNEANNQESNISEVTQIQPNTPQQSVENIPSQPPESTLPQKTGKKWLLPGLIGLAVVASGVASYLAYQNFQLKKEQPSLGQTTQSPTSDIPSPTTNPTSDWETYSNTSAGFSIKHPMGWRKAETANWVGFGPQEIGEDVLWGVSFYNKSEKTVAQIKDDIGKQFSDRKQTEEAITLEGLNATKVITTTNQFADWYSVTIIINNGNVLYTVSNGAQTDMVLNEMLTKKTGEDYNISFEDFYTSFTRLITDLTLRWETYENEKYKYEITYPKGLLSDRLYGAPSNADPRSEIPTNQSDNVCFRVEGPGTDTCIQVLSQSLNSKLGELKTSLPLEQKVSNKSISGIEWTLFIGTPDTLTHRTSYSIFMTEKNDLLYAIAFVVKETSDEMMSSFKFSE